MCPHRVIGGDDGVGAAQSGADTDSESVGVDLGGSRGRPQPLAHGIRHLLDIAHPALAYPIQIAGGVVDEFAADGIGQVVDSDVLINEDLDPAGTGK